MTAPRLKPAEYDEMLAQQGGVCAICGKRPGKTRLAYDHDHETGQGRGLLHLRCNRALAPFEWSDDVLRRAIAYMQRIVDKRELHRMLTQTGEGQDA